MWCSVLVNRQAGVPMISAGGNMESRKPDGAEAGSLDQEWVAWDYEKGWSRGENRLHNGVFRLWIYIIYYIYYKYWSCSFTSLCRRAEGAKATKICGWLFWAASTLYIPCFLIYQKPPKTPKTTTTKKPQQLPNPRKWTRWSWFYIRCERRFRIQGFRVDTWLSQGPNTGDCVGLSVFTCKTGMITHTCRFVPKGPVPCWRGAHVQQEESPDFHSQLYLSLPNFFPLFLLFSITYKCK